MAVWLTVCNISLIGSVR